MTADATPTPSQVLIAAARTGDIATARRALDAGADANAFVLENPDDSESRLSALYFACSQGHVAVARLLLERGAKPDDGESAYHAAEFGHVECLQALLEHGADFRTPHPRWKNTPLNFLAGYASDHPQAAQALLGTRWLLEHGADANVATLDTLETPLHHVARRGRHLELAELLISHGARLDTKRHDGRDAMALAVRSGSVEMTELLARHGAAGAPATAVQPMDELIGALRRGDEARARALTEASPALLAQVMHEGHALLAESAFDRQLEAVRLLVKLGFDPAWESAWGGTAMHHAAWQGELAIVELLLELGAPVNARDSQFGSSPLAWAAHGSANCRTSGGDYLAVVDRLLAAGSTREASFNKYGEPPEQLANEAVAAHLRAVGFATRHE